MWPNCKEISVNVTFSSVHEYIYAKWSIPGKRERERGGRESEREIMTNWCDEHKKENRFFASSRIIQRKALDADSRPVNRTCLYDVNLRLCTCLAYGVFQRDRSQRLVCVRYVRKLSDRKRLFTPSSFMLSCGHNRINTAHRLSKRWTLLKCNDHSPPHTHTHTCNLRPSV